VKRPSKRWRRGRSWRLPKRAGSIKHDANRPRKPDHRERGTLIKKQKKSEKQNRDRAGLNSLNPDSEKDLSAKIDVLCWLTEEDHRGKERTAANGNERRRDALFIKRLPSQARFRAECLARKKSRIEDEAPLEISEEGSEEIGRGDVDPSAQNWFRSIGGRNLCWKDRRKKDGLSLEREHKSPRNDLGLKDQIG